MVQSVATQHGSESNPLDTTGLCLLSLDGGGVRGLSTLYILKGLMMRLNHQRQSDGLNQVKPCDVFDLIGGTSTGGLIAIMLGRLEMDVDTCIASYSELMKTVFEEKSSWLPISRRGKVKARFDSAKLKGAIDKAVSKTPASSADAFSDGKARGCRTFVCATAKETAGVTRLRDYTLPDEGEIPATISEAALATSAATGFFDPVSIGARQFVDGALGANNPVDEVEGEAANIWSPGTGDLKPLVKCFISVGTGNPGKKALKDNVIKFLSKSLVGIATETEETERKFIARWAKHYDEKRYFRFNVDQGLQDVGLAEYKEQGRMQAATDEYLRHQAQKFRVRDCIENLQQKQDRTDTSFVFAMNEFVFRTTQLQIASGAHRLHHGDTLPEHNIKMQAIQAWLQPMNFRVQLAALLDKLIVRDRATFEKPEAKAWMEHYGGVVNIIGHRGYGKTTFVATLVDSIAQISTDDSIVSYAFCRNLATSTVLKSLIWQICQRDSNTASQAKRVSKAYQEICTWETGQEPTDEQKVLFYRNVYTDMLQGYDHVTLVFDAVDQSDSTDHLVRLVSFLAGQLYNMGIQSRVLLTSQQEVTWPKTRSDGPSLIVLPIIKDDLARDITNFVSLCTDALQYPMSDNEKSEVLSVCLRETDSGWPFVMHKMATTYMHRQRYEEAQKIEEAVLEYRQGRFLDESIPTIECKRILAVTLSEQGHLKKSEEMQKSLLEIWSRTHAPEDDLSIQLMNDLGLTLASGEKWEEAKEFQIQLVSILERKGEESGAMLRGVLNNLAITYSNLELLDEAEDISRRLLEYEIESEGADSEAVCDAKCNLGQILARQSKWAEAEELEVSSMEWRKRRLGMDNLKTLQSVSNVGWALAQQGQFARAKELQLQVLAGRIKLRGAGHQETLSTYGNLAWTVSQLGDRDEARRYARIALGYM